MPKFSKEAEYIKKLILIIMALVTAMSLSSCDVIELYPEELMRPPVFSQEQREIYDVLYKTLGNDFTLQYPTNGNNRSAIVIHDIDKNGEKEALVFYKKDKDSDTRINVLTHTGNTWRSACDVSGYSGEIFEVDFLNISTNNQTSVLVGFNQGMANTNTMILYEYVNKRLMPVYIRDYSAAQVIDLNSDGTNELVAINNNFSTRNSYATILYLNNGNTILGDDVQMNEDVSEYLQILSAKMPDGTPALYIDSKLSSGSVITEILSYKNDVFTNFSYGYDSVLIETSMRQTGILCKDINDDGIVEIPVSVEPIYESLRQDTVYLTAWKQFDTSDVYTVKTTAENLSYGYRVFMKAEWLDNNSVIIKNIISNNEWRFLGLAQDDNEYSETVMSIRVYSNDEIIDATSLTGYTKFATSGNHSYYVYIPENAPDEYKITLTEFKQMFEFLQ